VIDTISRKELRNIHISQMMIWGITKGIDQKLEMMAERIRGGAVIESDEQFDLVQKRQIKLRGPKSRTEEDRALFFPPRR
jgi:hypothetical protein